MKRLLRRWWAELQSLTWPQMLALTVLQLIVAFVTRLVELALDRG